MAENPAEKIARLRALRLAKEEEEAKAAAAYRALSDAAKRARREAADKLLAGMALAARAALAGDQQADAALRRVLHSPRAMQTIIQAAR